MNSGSFSFSKILMVFGLIVLFGFLLLFIFNKLNQEKSKGMSLQEFNSELIGESGSLKLSGERVSAQVQLDTRVMERISEQMLDPAISDYGYRVYLHIEKVVGQVDANILEVQVNGQTADHVSFFGLRNASEKRDDNEESIGLSFDIDISDIIRDHCRENADNLGNLELHLIPNYFIPDEEAVVISNVSVHKIYHKE